MHPSTAIAVVGGGPLGAATAQALAARHHCRVHWFEANDPIKGDFSRLSMSCPWAAGQVLVQSFEPDSPGKRYGMRTLAVFNELGRMGWISVQPRPWVVCARKGDAARDAAAREVLDAAWRAGRMEGCVRLGGDALRRFAGLQHDDIEFAVCDEAALGVDPRALIVGLTAWAGETAGVVPHFGARVTSIASGEVVAETAGASIRVCVQGVVLCVGIHGASQAGSPMPEVEGRPLNQWIPEARVTHLHVFDHRSAGHVPAVNCSVAGAATIARYEVFGPERTCIVPHLPEATRTMDVNPLLTDVPGLCRLLDTHFATEEEAAKATPSARESIAEMLRELIEPSLLPGEAGGRWPVTEQMVARYVKHAQPDDAPLFHRVGAGWPVWYVQPTNGRGLTQCMGLGEEAARRVAEDCA